MKKYQPIVIEFSKFYAVDVLNDSTGLNQNSFTEDPFQDANWWQTGGGE